MQLRTDGSVKVDSSFAVVGGALRDNHGIDANQVDPPSPEECRKLENR
ncbi:hypothetical protein Godav_006358, partial [Gossypium davidsonii]|nr:hypothetical protein [Gossypium davidsonii]